MDIYQFKLKSERKKKFHLGDFPIGLIKIDSEPLIADFF